MYVFRTMNSLSISFCIVPRSDVNTESFLSSPDDDDDDDDDDEKPSYGGHDDDDYDD